MSVLLLSYFLSILSQVILLAGATSAEEIGLELPLKGGNDIAAASGWQENCAAPAGGGGGDAAAAISFPKRYSATTAESGQGE